MNRISVAFLVCLAAFVPASQSGEIFSTNATWRLFKGRAEASSPDITAWRTVTFNDTNFSAAPAPFTYGENYSYGTLLTDMLNQYTCIFLRRLFELTNVADIAALRLGAKVDDGFVAWINGVEVQRVNMAGAPGSPVTTNTLSIGAPSEPVPFVFYDLASPANYLLNGTNVIAIQVFNVSLSSSDLVFDGSLEAVLVDTNLPAIASVDPPPGASLTSLTQITVTFTEPVSGVSADDLIVNALSATGLSGGGATYTFSFPQPIYGAVAITWAPSHGIVDLAVPPNLFDATAPNATWQYELRDVVPPTVTRIYPTPGSIVRTAGQIEVLFSEDVAGVDAADLLLNDQPVTNVIARPGALYLFQFAPPATGAVQVAWADGHGITDLAVAPNPFAGGTWSFVFDPNAAAADLVINEILAANATGLNDPVADPQDPDPLPWIELYNRGGASVDLAGWALSDDPTDPGQWVFPSRTLQPGEYLVVFASGLNIKTATGTNRFHTNFKLSRTGEFLGLYSPDSPRVLVSGFAPAYPEQRNDISYGLDAQGNLRYFATPTPGAPNGPSSITGVATPVHFSVPRGHFSQPFTLTLSSPTPGATIRYTTNGSEPALGNGFTYIRPLGISNQTLLRAAAFRTNLLSSRIGTHSYLFNLPAGYRTLPFVSIVTDQNNLTGPRGIIGISNVVQQGDGTYVPRDATGYHNPSQHGIAWERPTSVEWIQPGDNSGFQVDAGIRVQGSDYQRPRTTTSSKFSFRLYFRGDYGSGRLDYPLFPLTSVHEFDQLVLRAGFNEQGNPFIRDELTRRLSSDEGTVASHGNFAILLLNGALPPLTPYYNPCERVHEEFLQAHIGGGEEWDVVGPTFAQSAQGPGIIDGDRADFQSLVNYVRTQPTTNAATYLEIGRRLDLTNLVDYLLLNAYCAMGDWPQNNWRAGKDRAPGGPGSIWRFVVWDGEWAMGIYGRSVALNMFTLGGPGPDAGGLSSTNDSEIAQMYQRLYLNPEFRLLWADRIHKHMFNGGALTDSNIVARFTQMQSNLLGVIPSMNTDILTTWVPQRRGILFTQFNAVTLMASSNAPFFNQHGGRVPRGFSLTMTATNIGGTIYFTTNGGDPRIMFTRAIAANAVAYTAPMALGQSMTVRARTLNGSNWSALAEAPFEVGTIGVPLRITELHYHPPDGNAYEFLELQNVGTATLDLGGMTFEGITFRFNEGTILAGGATAVLASDTDPAAFALRYPGVAVVGYFAGRLDNAGERIALRDRFGNLITSVDYHDAGGWPTAADGGGPSLEVIDPLGDPDDPANWRASAQPGGSPGVVTPPPALPTVRLNEVMADNGGTINHAGTYPDWVELFNSGADAASVGGWSLSNDGEPRKFIIPSGTEIAAGGYLVVWCDAATNTTPGLHSGFGLGRGGDQVYLFDAATNLIDTVGFGLQLSNYSVGRIGNEWHLTVPTTNAPNVVATVAAASELSINEWLANPPVGQPDWVELYNRSLTLPAALRGLTIATSNALSQVQSLSFIAPGGFVQLLADEGVGPDHLDLRLPASGGTIALYDPAAVEVNRVTYGPQSEGVSRGRFPDGAANMMDFPGTASPGASNYTSTYTGPVFNEVLARSLSLGSTGRVANFVELYNPGAGAFDLGGMSVSVNATEARQWIFPPGTLIPGRGYVVVWCDSSRPASTNVGNFNTGRALDDQSGGAYLFNAAGQMVNAIEYGFQITGLPIGVIANQWRLLALPTPGATNAAPNTLGTNTALRLNEWMAYPASGPDWFELCNTTNVPVDLANLFLSDDPSIAGTNLFRVPPLSFIPGSGFVKWVADSQPADGRNHVNFSLDAQGETLLLFTPNGALLDAVAFGAQRAGVSEGRWPDGGPTVYAFPGSPTPGEANYLLLPEIVINEVLTHTVAPLEDAVELHNVGSESVAIGGWFLSDSQSDLRKYRIPDNTVIPPGGFHVIYENAFNTGPTAFALDGAHGGEVWLSATDGFGNFTGGRAGAKFGPAANGMAFGRYTSRLGTEYLALAVPTFGVDNPATLEQFRSGTGASNAAPLVGPVIINEIMYHPPDETNGSAGVEYVELRNITVQAVALYDAAHATNIWRLAGGIEYAFPSGVILAAGAHLLVVDFDPAANAGELAAFRSRYGVPTDALVFGPFTGKLNNAGDTVKLLKPDVPQPPAAPDAGFVPMVLVEQVDYSDAPPWPAGAVDGGGLSLQRRTAGAYANDPQSWMAAAPTPGTANSSAVAPPPVVVQSPAAQTTQPGATVSFSVLATGTAPLAYQWRFNGVPLPGATNAALLLDYVTLDQLGDYDVFVSNAGGSAFSDPAFLLVNAAPVILEAPQSRNAQPGSNVLFSVTATGTTPLRYQWRFNGTDIPGATGPTLLVTNVGLAQAGIYTVVVSNRVATTEVSATLVVLVRPAFALQPVSQTVVVGSTASFSVMSTGALPIGHRWRRAGTTVNPTNLPNGFIFSTPSNSVLTITNVQLTNAAAYTVVASNVAGTTPASSAANLTVLADSDGDGLPDSWETNHFGFNPNDPADGARDDDGDGMSNAAEWFAGTDYLDPTSFLKVELTVNQTALVQFAAVSNRTYTVQYTDGLNPIVWRKLGDVLARTNTRPETLPDPGGGINRFYRLVTPSQP